MDGYAYVSGSAKDVHIIDISHPASASVIGAFETETRVANVNISGEYALFGYGGNELQILDINQPAKPVILDTIELPAGPRTQCIDGKHVYVFSYYYSGG